MENLIPENHTSLDYYMRFRRASSEETLDIMYHRAMDKAQESFSGTVLVQVQCEIMLALDKRQVEFDSTSHGIKEKIDYAHKSFTEISSGSGKRANLTPEEEMSFLLNMMG